MHSRSVLVFPAGIAPALAWVRQATRDGLRIVGASSLSPDPAQTNYREWTWLPRIGDADFRSALSRCLTDKRIDSVFTPDPAAWIKLAELLPKVAPHVRLEAGQADDPDLDEYRAYRDIAAGFDLDRFRLPDSAKPSSARESKEVAAAMSAVQAAALVREFQRVPGRCDIGKLEAIIAIFRAMPRGDLIEIGSNWGRSAVALAFLSRHYRIGNLLCVGAWSEGDLNETIPDNAFQDTPADEILQGFRINLAPYAGCVNYSRANPGDAAFLYHGERSFLSDDFGWTPYRGEIALLHIDGSLSRENVSSSIRAWIGPVRAGGWVILDMDDGRWPSAADRSRMAADEFLAAIQPRVAATFVAGGALFARISGS